MEPSPATLRRLLSPLSTKSNSIVLSRVLILSLTLVDDLLSHFDRQMNVIHHLSDYHVGANDDRMSGI